MAETNSSNGTPRRRNGNMRANEHHKSNPKTPPVWTVLVYLGGDNNLTANCISVLQQLEAVEYSKDVCVLACFDSNTPWPKGSRYLAINCRRRSTDNGLDWEIHNDLIPPEKRNHKFTPPSFCETVDVDNARPVMRYGVAEGLRRFIKWAMKYHGDSERYMLILYGHGPLVAGQTFLARENPKSSLQLEDLQGVLSPYFGPHRKLDILACQNCVMNGVETAYEVKDQVDVMIGSQGLVLAAGWPYEKIISSIVKRPGAPPDLIALDLLKACARHLIDFAIMDRSSEQSVCDIRKLAEEKNITTAIQELVKVLREGLDFEEVKGEKKLRYPAICDAVRLARLEAQSYWGKTFVDVYDFCERLLKRCNEAVRTHNVVLKQMGYDGELQAQLRQTKLVQLFRNIIHCCITVMEKSGEMVPNSYYIGSDLQYSHGLSIFFPWTMPGEPYFFLKRGSDYILKTAFETYSQYKFVKESGWGDFLESFFKATLRKVRRADRRFTLRAETESLDLGLIKENISPKSEVLTGDLQKSSSSTGYVDHEVWSYVKNYPRRNYLSPSDCRRKIDDAGCMISGRQPEFPNETSPPVSYLGWNISGLVAEVITKPSAPNGGANEIVGGEALLDPPAAAAPIPPATRAPQDQ